MLQNQFLLFLVVTCFTILPYADSFCQSVSCDSNSYRYNRCKVSKWQVTSVSVQHRRSRSSCTYGRSYGKVAGDIWVHHGCRATFNVCYNRRGAACRSVSCDSNSYRYNKCKVPGSAKVVSVSVQHKRSKSHCKYGRSYGKLGGDIWVHRGCRATFDVCYTRGRTADISCSSNHCIRATCYAGGKIKSVTLLKKISKSSCIPGYSYGKEGNRIYVNHGCRGVFRVFMV